MRCTDFLFNLPDWVSNRITPDVASRMEEHSRACQACAEALAEERDMSSLFQAVPAPTRTPDLWYKVSAKLEQPARAPRLLWQRFYAMGGALAAAAVLCVVMIANQPGPGPSAAPPTGVSVSAAVYDVRHRPQEAESAFFEESNYTQRRALLAGYSSAGME